MTMCIFWTWDLMIIPILIFHEDQQAGPESQQAGRANRTEPGDLVSVHQQAGLKTAGSELAAHNLMTT